MLGADASLGHSGSVFTTALAPMLHVVAPASDGDGVPSRAPEPPAPESPVAVACAARPSTRFAHRDGPCCCFFGGPAPALVSDATLILHHAS